MILISEEQKEILSNNKWELHLMDLLCFISALGTSGSETNTAEWEMLKQETEAETETELEQRQQQQHRKWHY